MARQRSHAQPSSARRTLRMARDFLLIFGVAFLLPWLGYRILHHPKGTGPTVPAPTTITVGREGSTLASGDYRLTVDSARWIRQSSLPKGLKLSFRARPSPLVDYVVVAVTVANVGTSPLPFSFEGAEQDVNVPLVSTDPQAFHTEPISPSEAHSIAGDAPLESGTLRPGERRNGVLVFAIERYRKGLELLLVPDYPVGVAPDRGPQHPAFEVRLTPRG